MRMCIAACFAIPFAMSIGGIFVGPANAFELAPAASVATPQNASPNEKAAVDLVRSYFFSYEARDTSKLAGLFTSDARIVRYYGEQIDVPSLLQAVAKLKKPESTPEFTIGNFEFVDGGAAVVITFDVQGYADGTGEPGNVPGEIREPHKFRTSWILVPSSNGPKIAWAVDVPYGDTEDSSTTIHPSSPPGTRPRLSGEDEAAAAYVEHFFSLFSRMNQAQGAKEMRAMFLPGAKIVHCNGMEQSIGDFLTMFGTAAVPTTKYRRPKPGPTFDHITTRHFGDLVLISFDNHVWHWRDGHSNVEHAFRENWLLKRTNEGLKALWSIYPIYGAIPLGVGEKVRY